MAYELFTSWQDYRQGLQRLLSLVQHNLSIFDGSLERLHLDKPETIDQLRAFLAAAPQAHAPRLRMVLRQTARLNQTHPRLIRLLERYSHSFKIIEVTPQLAHLKDGLLLADGRHGLICFHEDQARAKLLLDEPDALAPYVQRFESLWHEGGTAYVSTPVGL